MPVIAEKGSGFSLPPSLFLDERLGGSENPPPFSAMTGVRKKKKNGEAMFCGWRKMAGGVMLARE